MSLTKRILVCVASLLVLASAAMAELHAPVKVTREQVRDFFVNLKASGAAPAVDPRTLPRSRATASPAVPGVIRTNSQYGQSLLVSGLGYGQGLGVGTLGDYVLINDGGSEGGLFIYKNRTLTDLGAISPYYLTAGRMWGHYYFGDYGGNLFRLESDNHTVTPILELNIYNFHLSALDIDRATGVVYFAINDYVSDVGFYVFFYDPSTDDLYYVGGWTDFCYGLAIKGNYIYFSLWYNNLIIRWNWKKGGSYEVFTDKVWGPCDLAFDAKGNLFVCDYSSQSILKFNPTATMRTKIAWDVYDPEYIGLDQRGNVYFDTSSGEVWKLRKK